MRRPLALPLVLVVLGGCAGDITWRKVATLEPGTGRFHLCGDGAWLTGSPTLHRSTDGVWSTVDLCGDVGRTPSGQPAATDLVCPRGGGLVVHCGTALVAFDAARQGRVISLPAEGSVLLVPTPEGALVATEAAIYAVEDGALRSIASHAFGRPLLGAGASADDFIIRFDLPEEASPVQRFQKGVPVPAPAGQSYVVRDGHSYLVTEGSRSLVVTEVGGDGETNEFPLVRAFDHLAGPDVVVGLSAAPAGYEYDSHGSHLWLTEAGADDSEYVGQVEFATTSALYVSGGGGLLGAIDEDTYLGVKADTLYEGTR